MVQRYETLSRRTIRLSPNTYNAMRDKVAEGGFVLGVVELHIAQSIIIN